MEPILIQERYQLDRKIANGGCGAVYCGIDTKTGMEVAIKLMEPDDVDGLNEIAAYRKIGKQKGFPRMLWSGVEGDFLVIIQELLGPSLSELYCYSGSKLSLKTVLWLAQQLLSRIEAIHKKKLLHMDIKPDNFLIGLKKKGNTIHAVDFGLAKEFHGDGRAEENETYEEGENASTLRYASVNNHKGLAYSWGDDLESLAYMLVFLATGELPWTGFDELDVEESDSEATVLHKMDLAKQNHILMKTKLTAAQICYGLPVEFTKFLEYARSLGFGQKPNYWYLRRLFRRRYNREGFSHDYVFDWTIRRYDEIRETMLAKEKSDDEGDESRIEDVDAGVEEAERAEETKKGEAPGET
ncbi:kinase-like domain-containing protein [Stachybotrys elegans]|uniref:non-specific serine/threonine protein kinase n=1 Tax=Stachybotrys elegans TaxID=80388 RepID=A0A8K0WY77_9HYPO|nr:kinase-like domain-containing protein [Stachybotrys elegans]